RALADRRGSTAAARARSGRGAHPLGARRRPRRQRPAPLARPTEHGVRACGDACFFILPVAQRWGGGPPERRWRGLLTRNAPPPCFAWSPSPSPAATGRISRLYPLVL